MDVDRSAQGRTEAAAAGQALRCHDWSFDVAFTSLQKRAIRTLWMILDEMDLMGIPVNRCWRLNERHYGALQGLNKAETVRKFGEAQVYLWRRGYDTPPPALEIEDPRYPGHDPRYQSLEPGQIPRCESLKDTVARFMPYWQGTIGPALLAGQRVLMVSHGNSLRALAKHLDGLSDEEVVNLEIPTGIPIVYTVDANLRSVGHHDLDQSG